ncbi:MAG: lactate utilization protein [Gemmatimonadota bacterium]|nr:lactate utilization protein [Gemmatimonadota bacterium]MDH5759743.1 lactate utilization protein [Gemmatimonadota bacterium]
MNARDGILGRVREAVARRERREHPGSFQGWRPEPLPEDALVGFTQLFEAAGGEVLRFESEAAGREWLHGFAAAFAGVAVGETVPAALRPDRPALPPETAPLGVSMARGAVAETGSLVLDARDGRRTQLLPPTHVVFVRRDEVVATLQEALAILRDDLPSAVGLHSGPSKSADIGQILVKGVHGPGRVVAAVVGTVGTGP